MFLKGKLYNEELNELKKIKTLIVVEHDMGFVRRIADVVTVMHMGSLLAKGSIEQIEKNQEKEKFTTVDDNYDLDGPISSYYGNLLNYELQAPGTSIISTIPNGGYATLTGTSMAAPLVAGGLALYKEQNPDEPMNAPSLGSDISLRADRFSVSLRFVKILCLGRSLAKT